MTTLLKRIFRWIRIALEALVFTAIMILWLSWTIGGESPTKFIYYNF
jgi:hypothetical protein